MNDAEMPQIDAARIERDVRQKLATFQSRYPLRSLEIDRRTWVFRRTPGRAARQVPIVMLPGIQGGGDIFFEAALSLGELMPVITINAPDIQDVAQIRAGLAGLLSKLGIRRTNILGSSLGGYLAQSFALLHSDNVAQLVIANGFIDVAAFIITLPPASTVAAMDAADLVQQNLRALFAMPNRSEGEARLKAAVKALVGPAQTLENYKSRVLLMMGAQPLAEAPIAPERVMIIDDDHDPLLLPAMRDAVRKRFARSEQHSIDGGGHLPAVQRPARFAELLTQRLITDAPNH
jgi:pimeloyl-ACP methyl ester carboxylesterase